MQNWVDWRVRLTSDIFRYAVRIILGALGTCAIRIAKAYAIIKKANHND